MPADVDEVFRSDEVYIKTGMDPIPPAIYGNPLPRAVTAGTDPRPIVSWKPQLMMYMFDEDDDTLIMQYEMNVCAGESITLMDMIEDMDRRAAAIMTEEASLEFQAVD